MRSILIAIDFSENAERALAAAKLIAEKDATELLILHAYQPYIADVNVTPGNVMPGIGGADFLAMTSELEQEFHKRLDEYAARLVAEGYNAKTIWTIGTVQSAIEEAINDHVPDMIVIGRTGTGGFLDKLIGSSATHIALNSPCPVLVVPPQTEPTKFKKVVYATQFEYEENNILREVFVLMNHLGADLTLLKINSDTQPDIQPDNQYITEIKSHFTIREGQIVIREAKHVLDGIEAYCDEVQADLLIMSTRERSFIEEYLINPSITRKLVVDTHVPLLVFHLK
ncbi:nucleotide-binding universal stress UspA family protein [Dyadobacter sp. BE34]|uniref:Nucleotide-binding universal stress UspA family protein n=1 Tax=Dyadobacter fermentans TaxID=94254 RepID=A0ABU1QS59_9BACT|nr:MULTISPECIES: universal stress protein [Dyadobacter]MBZ1358128.1 universal stress protein [Dyadobacter fermentans]MDR6803996.1 nucleotide-binding universal stress UspA family protein [Dyadobacter fermentans]MDR7041736.1 nucleotide-binding universal stress UspA family protein [Dyadobacter sp. BE242]MDR7196139.1 nucleotide-binding universal stress UspA family protein [Dyadobacter sp. BE34]MDR7213316.1 nucleotide-binding universal stress UspA family protein [Dyadobacter sp. BE31]